MAKKFKFRPEVVLKLRVQREQTAQRRFALAQAEVARLQEDIRRLRGQLEEQTDLVRQDVQTGKVDVKNISLYRRHTMVLHRRILAQVQDLRGAAETMQQARAELAEALKRRKVLSRLKEKQARRYREELDKAQQRELDELTTMRFGHARLAGESD